MSRIHLLSGIRRPRIGRIELTSVAKTHGTVSRAHRSGSLSRVANRPRAAVVVAVSSEQRQQQSPSSGSTATKPDLHQSHDRAAFEETLQYEYEQQRSTVTAAAAATAVKRE